MVISVSFLNFLNRLLYYYKINDRCYFLIKRNLLLPFACFKVFWISSFILFPFCVFFEWFSVALLSHLLSMWYVKHESLAFLVLLHLLRSISLGSLWQRIKMDSLALPCSSTTIWWERLSLLMLNSVNKLMLNSCNHGKSTVEELILIKKSNTSLPPEKTSLSSADILDWASKSDSINSFCNLFYLMN